MNRPFFFSKMRFFTPIVNGSRTLLTSGCDVQCDVEPGCDVISQSQTKMKMMSCCDAGGCDATSDCDGGSNCDANA